MAKESFHGEKLGKNLFGLATTGFNLNRNALIDGSKLASSSKYGKTEIQRAHPGWNVSYKNSVGRLEDHDSLDLQGSQSHGQSLLPIDRQVPPDLQGADEGQRIRDQLLLPGR
jgi:hypothetical protein